MEIRQLADMTAFEVDALDRDRTVVLLTISPIEEHGPHLPLATDIIEAQGLGRRLVARLVETHTDWTFLEYPPIPLGAGCFAMPGTANIRASAVRAAVMDIARSFAREGFRWFVVLSHHGGLNHNLALEAAARSLSRWTRARMLALSGRMLVELYLGKGLHPFYASRGIPESEWPEWDVDVHAGAFETSEIMALRPDLVRSVYTELEPSLVPVHHFSPASGRRLGTAQGYFGAPARASAELGSAFLDLVIDRVLPDVRRFLAGERVRGMPLRWRLLFRLGVIVSTFRDLFARRSGARRKVPAA